jgi:hypothetical protein
MRGGKTMADPVTPGVMDGFREILHEFRGVGNALGEVVQRTARLEVKVDRLITDQANAEGMRARIAQLENWVKAELDSRAMKGRVRGLWIAAVSTLAGGTAGALISHFWK